VNSCYLQALALLLVNQACACAASSADKTPSPSGFDGTLAGVIPVAPQILVDQFGYLPGEAKTAVIRDPQIGFDTNLKFAPGAHYQLRRADDGAVVLTGPVRAWNGGAVQVSSGDRGWWFDFSTIDRPGRYFVYDAERKVRSPTFSIDPHVYRSVLVAAMRMYYYQRSGLPKIQPYADPCWTDIASYAGPNQDGQAHDVTDRNNLSKVRDLSGGWFDAGDTNKYVTFAVQPVHQLLSAYEEHPKSFTDDFDIPESGNGLPDLIDEVKWEIDWIRKMQFDDGSVALKVGDIKIMNPSPPSLDTSERFYVPACTSSTIAAAGMFAHASYVFARFPTLKTYADELKNRAIRAWGQYQKSPAKQTHCDQGIVLAGNADRSAEDQASEAVEASVYLFAITADVKYQDYVRAHYRETRPYRDIGWSRYQPDQGESLLFFTRLTSADSGLRHEILQDKARDARAGNQIYGFQPADDLYRAFLHDPQYHWGSNNPRANYGNSNLDVLTYSIAANDGSIYRQRALEILHYFHGVNPLGMTYLTNMYSAGATKSANEIYHSWFQTRTKWSDARTSECGPPPGYVPGGPNANAAADGVPTSMRPPTGQPPQKSYRDWNGIWPDASWTVTEPAIYYQSAYVKLLSAFVP
jgi:endoglucanase